MMRYGIQLFINIKYKSRNCRWCRNFITEEHVTVGLVTEPGNSFPTHNTSESSNAAGNSYSIVDYYYKNSLDLDKLSGIGCCFSQRYNSNARTNLRTFHYLPLSP